MGPGKPTPKGDQGNVDTGAKKGTFERMLVEKAPHKKKKGGSGGGRVFYLSAGQRGKY